MSSSNELEDSNDAKTTFIDKLLGQMKSTFNKLDKHNSEDDLDDPPPKLKAETLVNAQSVKSEPQSPPKITKIDSASAKVSNKSKPSAVDEENAIKTENDSDLNTDCETKPRIVLTFRTEKSKNTVSTNYSADKDNSSSSAEESTSPGRRSLRIKTNSTDDKDKKIDTNMDLGLKRSARRRSKDCTESILQSAIARKEKSYNETTRPQRLTRKLKPTAKILANLEMCKNAGIKSDRSRPNDKTKSSNSSNKTSPIVERQRFSYDKLEKGSEQAILESDLEYIKEEKISDQLQKKFKRKSKHNSGKIFGKKAKISPTKADASDSDSSSFSSHQETEKEELHEEKSVKVEVKKSPRKSSSDTDSNVKTFRRSHRKSGKIVEQEDRVENADFSEPMSASIAEEQLSLVPNDPESSLINENDTICTKKCLCQQSTQIYMNSPENSTDVVYCTGLDSINSRIIGCNNAISGDLSMLRPSTRIPYLILCEIHKQRLLRHNCCPTCGLFCTQGKFTQCAARHQFHRDCCLVAGEKCVCPHCGEQCPDFDVEIVMRSKKRPVFLPVQKCHYPSAKMSFQGKFSDKNEMERERRVVSPPLIPVDALELVKAVDVSEFGEKFDLKTLFEAIKVNDCEKVAVILGSGQVNLSEALPDCEGMTVLHYASQEGLLAIVHMLLIAGNEQDLLDKEQNTPLMLAIQAFQNDVVKYLIKSGANIALKGTDGMTALHQSAKCGNLQACQLLLRHGRARHINGVDDGGWTPLVWACEHGHAPVTRYLLESGADALLRDVEQNVALHWAAFSGSSEIMEMLMAAGCEVDAVNAHGDSPLHVAARQDKYNCVLILLARGATVTLVNKSDETPLKCCQSQENNCSTAITLNIKLQSIIATDCRKPTILSNDISSGKEINPIQCVNKEDDEEKPENFVYIVENCVTSEINVDRRVTILQACQCADRCASEQCACGNNSFRCWYDEEARLNGDFNFSDPPMIFECNALCACNAITCLNRVVQRGLTQRFELFRTRAKGWGVRSLRPIPRGAFVCEYVGEIITDLEADQREDDSYLFDLDNRVRINTKDGETYCIDARRFGNLSRFINHSCDPNLIPVRVYVDHQDLRFPRIAFFARRDIRAGAELGFDYGEKFWIIKYKSFTCTCGVAMCRYSDTTIKATLERYQRRLVAEQ